jgi:peptide/nickel transport system permease protein
MQQAPVQDIQVVPRPEPEGTAAPQPVEVPAERRLGLARRFLRHRPAVCSLAILGILILVAVLAPLLSPYDPYGQAFDSTALPSSTHWLGTDEVGRDELSRIIFGARVSLGISIGAALAAAVLGLLIGAGAGYLGGLVDVLLMRLVDIMLAFPSLFLILIISVSIGITQVTLALLIGAFSWMTLARLVRAEFLSLKEQEYVMAARAIGVPSARIIWRHMLPNALGSVVVSATFILAGALFVEAALDFLGLGLAPDIPSWGNLLSASQDTYYDAPLLSFVPGALLSLTILCVNFVGDGLRDAFDPRQRT